MSEKDETMTVKSVLTKLSEAFMVVVNMIGIGDSGETEVKESAPTSVGEFMIWKDNQGQYRWLASYSNNYQDDDYPPDIISRDSHINFERMVDAKEVEYPELWHWHTKGTSWGKADWVAFDEETGIAMASGYILPGHEAEAEAMAALSKERPIGVSHGMPVSSIQRDPQNPKVITRHVTIEISDLPLEAAANKLTSFYVFEEKEMAISDKKKEYLRLAGLSDETIAKIELENQTKAQAAQELKLDSKETSEAVTSTEATETSETSNEASKETTETSEVTEATEKNTTEVSYVTQEDFVKAMTELGQMFVNKLGEMQTGLQKQISDLSEQKEKELSAIPTASLAAMVAKNLSVTNSKETVVSQKSALAKSGPVESESTSQEKQYAADPLTNQIIKSVLEPVSRS